MITPSPPPFLKVAMRYVLPPFFTLIENYRCLSPCRVHKYIYLHTSVLEKIFIHVYAYIVLKKDIIILSILHCNLL